MALFRRTFFQEWEELLTDFDFGLRALSGVTHDAVTLNVVFRPVHSIKGGAGAFALTDLAEFAKVFETSVGEAHFSKMATELKVNNFLKKPVSTPELKKKIEAVLGALQ